MYYCATTGLEAAQK